MHFLRATNRTTSYSYYFYLFLSTTNCPKPLQRRLVRINSYMTMWTLLWAFLFAYASANFLLPALDTLPFAQKRDEIVTLYDYSPITYTITQSELQRFVFPVNTTSGIGSAYELLIFLTGNICLQPDDLEASAYQSLAVYYSFNELMYDQLEISQMELFTSGYFQGLAEVPTTGQTNLDDYLNLYLAVRAPQSTNQTAQWTYEIGISQSDLVFQWDSRSFALVVDTDDRSALIVTGNLTGHSNDHLNSTYSGYHLYIYSSEYKDYFTSLNNSWCAVRNGPALLSSKNYTTSYSTRGNSLRQQFYVTGLNASTLYIGYLLFDVNQSYLGGVVYSVFDFETMDSNACSLVYDLDFCTEVAYAVPALSLEEYQDKDELKLLYDGNAERLYTNFSKAIQQVACNTTKDAIYSPIRTCSECITLYKNWLCAVTIPRCSTNDFAGFVERTPGNSRNDFLNDNVVPNLTYYEVMPCVNVCNAIVRDCPADLGFTCPTTNSSIELSYYWDLGTNYSLCNYVGLDVVENNGAVVRVMMSALLVSITTVMIAV